MSQQNKSALWEELKRRGVTFDQHFRNYTEAQLQTALDELDTPQPEGLSPLDNAINQAGPLPDAEAAAFFGFQSEPAPTEPTYTSPPSAPVAAKSPDEIAGQRTNTQPVDEPIRIDPETGWAWYQEEVLKPAYPKPRARRVLRYQDAGVQTRTVINGDYSESFEISGDPANAREAEVKITMPSYQVGIYKDKRFPFKIVTYNGKNGFHREDVIDFYGGAELVPAEVARVYVENVLCWDIASVIKAINDEHRRLTLQRGNVHA